jgi:hypothetical protein
MLAHWSSVVIAWGASTYSNLSTTLQSVAPTTPLSVDATLLWNAHQGTLNPNADISAVYKEHQAPNNYGELGVGR